jgi:putative transposase
MQKIELYRIRDKADIHAFVIMPNHFHLLIGIPEGSSISSYMRDLKKRIAYEYFKVFNLSPVKFWQGRFDCFDITSEETYNTKLNYIHYNPVKKGLVERPEDWEYSSARFYPQVIEE